MSSHDTERAAKSAFTFPTGLRITHFTIQGQQKKITPFNEQIFDLGYQSLRVSYIFQVCVQQGKSRCIIQIVSSAADKSTKSAHLGGSGCFRRSDEGNIVAKNADELFRSLIGERWTTPINAIVMYRVVPYHHDIPIGIIECHTANTTSCVLQYFCRLSLPLSRYCQCEYSSSGCKVKCRIGTLAELNPCYWLFRLKDSSLLGASVMYQVPSYDSDRAICKPYCKLREVLECRKGRNLSLSAPSRK